MEEECRRFGINKRVGEKEVKSDKESARGRVVEDVEADSEADVRDYLGSGEEILGEDSGTKEGAVVMGGT